MKSLRPLVMSLALAAFAPAALAGTTTNFGFACYTNNTGSCSSFASQLALTIEETSATTVQFKFTNAGPTGVITDIYFDVNRSPLVRVLSLTVPAGQTGVAYGVNAAPGNGVRPPGSNAFSWGNSGVTDFLVFPSGTPTVDGVNSGQALLINGVLGGGVTYAQLIASFTGPSIDSRIGLHIQSLGSQGQSEGMYAVPSTTVVPVPGALPMMLGGLIGIGYLARRRKG